MFPYADENPSPGNNEPIIALILVNVFVFLLLHNADAFQAWGFIPTEPGLYRWFTSQFLHGNIDHIIGNMWALYIFGDNVAARLKRLFFPFYILGGLAANFAYYLAQPSSTIPAIGASGAICAVIGIYAVLFPKARLKCLSFPIRAHVTMSALLWAGIYLVWQFIAAANHREGGGIAYSAHAGGLLFGIAMGMAVRAFEPDAAVERSAEAGDGPEVTNVVTEIETALAEGNRPLAASLFARAYRRNPYLELENAEFQLNIADVLCDAGRPHLAYASLELLVRRYPNSAQTATALCYLGYVEQTFYKDFDMALSRYEAAAILPASTAEQRADAKKRIEEVQALLAQTTFESIGETESCAIVLETAPPLSPIAKNVISSVAGASIDDCSGFIARQMQTPQALRHAANLEKGGVHVVVIPERRIVSLPKARIIPMVSFGVMGLEIDGNTIPWEGFRLILAYSVVLDEEKSNSKNLEKRMPDILDVEISLGTDLADDGVPFPSGQQTFCVELVAQDKRLRWLCEFPGKFYEMARGLTEAAPHIPADLGVRSACSGCLPDALVFNGAQAAEKYTFWQMQLAVLKCAKTYS